MKLPIYKVEEGNLGRLNCGVCGDGLVRIRGRYPHDEPRDVCATCSFELLESIKSYFEQLNEPAQKTN